MERDSLSPVVISPTSPSYIEKLQKELHRLHTKLHKYERSVEKVSAEEERKKIRKIFDMFDADSSGDLDAKEFQELAFMLGMTLTFEEVQDRISIIDQDDNGRIDFREFYEWWISPDHDFLKNSRRSDEMRLLKAKLRSKALMRTMTRLNEKVERQELQSEGKMDEVPQDDVEKISVVVNVGSFKEPACMFKLDFVQDEERAAEVRRELGAYDESSAVLSLSLTVKEGVTDFELGELSGSLKALLNMAKREVIFTSYKIHLREEDGVRLFRILILVDSEGFKKYEQLHKFVKTIHPQSLSILWEVSQSPNMQEPDQPFNFRFSVKGEIIRSSVELLRELLSSDEVDATEDEEGASGAPAVKSEDISVHLLSLLRTMDIEIQTDSVQELYEQVGSATDPSAPKEGKFPTNGWSIIKPLLVAFVVKYLVSSDDPPSDLSVSVMENYFTILYLCKGIHSARVQVGDLALDISTKGFDIFSLMPTKEEIENIKKNMTRERRKRRDSASSGKRGLYQSGGSARSLRSGGSARSLNSTKSNTTSQSEFETDLDSVTEEELTKRYFDFVAPSDKNGIIYFLDYRLGDPPEIFASSITKGSVDDFIERENVFCWTGNKPNSWFCVDMGQARRVIPNKYTMKYGSSGNFCCPRNWQLQGAVRLTSKMDSLDSPDWKVLSSHVDDKTFNSSWAVGIWDIPDPKTTEGFRYFRVIQTGPNCYVPPQDQENSWSNVFVVTGFEIYGELVDAAEQEPIDEYEEKSGHKAFNILYDNDTNGVLYFLKSTRTRFRVTASSIARGQPRDFVKRGEVYCWTQNRPFSWFMVDLGKRRSLNPTFYSLRYGSGGVACCPRNWLLQGATQLKDMTSNPDSEDWTTLSTHKNDKTFKEPHQIASFPIVDFQEYFRYFRIIQTGPNCFTGGSGWKDVLVATGFELYGNLQTIEGQEDFTDDEAVDGWSESSDDEAPRGNNSGDQPNPV